MASLATTACAFCLFISSCGSYDLIIKYGTTRRSMVAAPSSVLLMINKWHCRYAIFPVQPCSYPSSPTDHYLCRAGWAGLGWLVAIPFMRIITIIIISVISGHHHIVSINGRLCSAGWWIGYRVALKINTTTTTCRNLDRERDGTGRAGVFAYCIRFAEIITGLESSLTAIAAAPGTYTLPYTQTTPSHPHYSFIYGLRIHVYLGSSARVSFPRHRMVLAGGWLAGPSRWRTGIRAWKWNGQSGRQLCTTKHEKCLRVASKS